ncbi:hypothetical protein [Sinorhizobium psoraleae]|uniref:Uncharacterized protein n=1 Tax=Sinorhizobium psoraleae TaxID=520838 RepID=A0ABT4KI84_9HYPH|nr:hypothetical protein [Sinorhizobium psoraleae]MCZ4091684.1 hypothetical protein [Sinorhizobium psoraleae]
MREIELSPASQRALARHEEQLRTGEAVDDGRTTKREFSGSYENGVQTIWIKNATGARMIEGVASTPRPSVSGIGNPLALSSRGAMAQLPIPLMFAHAKGEAIGEVVLLRKSAEHIFVKAVIWQTEACDHAWRLIEAGEARAFSVLSGDQVFGATVDGYTHVKSWRIREVSVCRQGANPDCTFSIVGSKRIDPFASSADGWNRAKRYEPGQVINHGGSFYLAKIISKGVEPNPQDNLAWRRIK